MNREPDLDEQTFRVKDPLEVAKRRAEHESVDGVVVSLDRTLDGAHVVTWTTEHVEQGEVIFTRHRMTYVEPFEPEGGA